MNPQPDAESEPVPRPELTPDTLRAALAVVARARLPEMQRTKDDAFAKAVEWHSLSPVQGWLLAAWARDKEIARRPDLSARHARATRDLEHASADFALEGLRELCAVLDEAMRALPAVSTEIRSIPGT